MSYKVLYFCLFEMEYGGDFLGANKLHASLDNKKTGRLITKT